MIFQKVRKIKIFGHEFEIVITDNVNDLGALNGSVDYDKQKIFIRKGMKESQQSEVLIHECFHIGDYFAKIKDNGEEMSEAEVTRAANFITALEFEYNGGKP